MGQCCAVGPYYLRLGGGQAGGWRGAGGWRESRLLDLKNMSVARVSPFRKTSHGERAFIVCDTPSVRLPRDK